METSKLAPQKTNRQGNPTSTVQKGSLSPISRNVIKTLHHPPKTNEKPSQNANNKKPVNDSDTFEKSAEFLANGSQAAERRKQLNSSFEKPTNQRVHSYETKQPQKPTLAKPTQSATRIQQTKQQIITSADNNFEQDSPSKMLHSERDTRPTAVVRASNKLNSQKKMNYDEKTSEKQTKVLDDQPRHRSSSPLMKKDTSYNSGTQSQYEARLRMKQTPQKQNYVNEKKTIGLMSTTPYSNIDFSHQSHNA